MIVTLTPRPDFFPVPRVEIELQDELVVDGGSPGAAVGDIVDGGAPGGAPTNVFDGGSPSTTTVAVPDGTDAVTLWRVSEGRQMKVRGVVGRAFANAAGWVDLEAGFDIESTYIADCYSAGALLGRVNLGSVVLPWNGHPWEAVIQQPLDPRLYAVVTVNVAEQTRVSRSAPGSLNRPEGSGYPLMVGAGPRGGARSSARFRVYDRTAARDLWATLGSESAPQLPVWLVRSRNELLPRVLFTDARDVDEQSVTTDMGGDVSDFTLPITEVASPAPALVLGTLSYTDLDVSYASYDARDAAYVSYDEMDRDWSLTGAAGGA